MRYKKGYKYQLVADVQHLLPVWFPSNHLNAPIQTKFIDLVGDKIVVFAGYAWDGASCIPDIKNKQAALLHDALYQLMRNGDLPVEYKPACDRLFEEVCIEEGTPKWLARVYYKGLQRFGEKAATKPRKIYDC